MSVLLAQSAADNWLTPLARLMRMFGLRAWIVAFVTTGGLSLSDLPANPPSSPTCALSQTGALQCWGAFVENVTLSATMLPGVKVDASSFIKN